MTRREKKKLKRRTWENVFEKCWLIPILSYATLGMVAMRGRIMDH